MEQFLILYVKLKSEERENPEGFFPFIFAEKFLKTCLASSVIKSDFLE